jgi:MFS family permease
MEQTAVPPAERSFAETHLRWNFSVNVLDISFYTLALNMVSQATILPLLVSQLTGSKLAIGLIPAIYTLGYLLPQLLTAGYTEGLRRKLPVLMLVGSVGERLPFLLIGLAVLFFAAPSPILALGLLYLLLGISAVSNGILTPAWYDLIAKVIPVERRGIWSGVGNGLGAFMGIAGAGLAGWLLTAYAFPQNYALCFLVAFVFFMVSWIGLALNREPDSAVVKPQVGLWRYLKQLPAVLRRDRNYQVFLISQSVANLGGMAAGFFIVYGSTRFGLDGATVGALTGTLVASQALMNLLWGLLGDRKGHKIVLAGAAGCMALAALAALLIPTPAALWVVFFLLGASIAGEMVSSLNIILEFCHPEDRPTYIGLTNTLLAPVKALAPLVGAGLATLLGYPGLFIAAALAAAGGAALLGLWVREPRHRPKNGEAAGA